MLLGISGIILSPEQMKPKLLFKAILVNANVVKLLNHKNGTKI